MTSPAEDHPELRVLVVDDSVDAATSLSYLLQHIGARTSVAFGAQMGWRLLELFRPSLVFVNLEMPGIDGLEFLRRATGLEAAAEGALFVALSEIAVPEVEAACLSAGFARVVRKPMHAEVLAEVIELARGRLIAPAAEPVLPDTPPARRLA